MARAKRDVTSYVTPRRDVKYDVLYLNIFFKLIILHVCIPLFPSPPGPDGGRQTGEGPDEHVPSYVGRVP